MKVEKLKIQKHLGWLRANIEPYGVGASVIPSGKDPSREFRLISKTEYGAREYGAGANSIAVFRFQNPRLPRPGPRLLWAFAERWQVMRHSRTNAVIGLEFRGMHLSLMRERDVEYLSIHWNDPPTENKKYEPHWHVGSSTEGFFVHKLHIPQSVYWDCVSPPDLDFYYTWVENLLRFIDEEFPHCLIKGSFRV